jgi:hypothetical protein
MAVRKALALAMARAVRSLVFSAPERGTELDLAIRLVLEFLDTLGGRVSWPRWGLGLSSVFSAHREDRAGSWVGAQAPGASHRARVCGVGHAGPRRRR